MLAPIASDTRSHAVRCLPSPVRARRWFGSRVLVTDFSTAIVRVPGTPHACGLPRSGPFHVVLDGCSGSLRHWDDSERVLNRLGCLLDQHTGLVARTVARRNGFVMELHHAEPVGDVDDVVKQGASAVSVSGRVALEQQLRVPVLGASDERREV
jgi:hypothetical protein